MFKVAFLEGDNSTVNLIMLQKIFGEGRATTIKVYEALLENNLLDAKFEEIKNCGLFTPKIQERIKAADEKYARRILKECSDNRIKIVSILNEQYPERLKNIGNPPLVIYVKGNLPKIDGEPVICIVGPRKVSDFGAKAAYAISLRLAKAGFIIVSGCAVGSDKYAHIGAIKGGGKTIGLLGCGLLSNYLPENKKLREAIAQNCCLISEYPPRAAATKYTFPIRNRIMSALSLGTIVIEGDKISGALVTARHANDQGRDVFVIPGNPTLEHYKGSNQLLRDGATPLIDVSDVINAYIGEFAEKLDLKKAFEKVEKVKKEKKILKKSCEGLSKEAKILYNNLDRQKFTADDLLSAGITDDEILSALTELEIEGYIRAVAGGFYEVIE